MQTSKNLADRLRKYFERGINDVDLGDRIAQSTSAWAWTYTKSH